MWIVFSAENMSSTTDSSTGKAPTTATQWPKSTGMAFPRTNRSTSVSSPRLVGRTLDIVAKSCARAGSKPQQLEELVQLLGVGAHAHEKPAVVKEKFVRSHEIDVAELSEGVTQNRKHRSNASSGTATTKHVQEDKRHLAKVSVVLRLFLRHELCPLLDALVEVVS